jgi:hypothetical protein
MLAYSASKGAVIALTKVRVCLCVWRDVTLLSLDMYFIFNTT